MSDLRDWGLMLDSSTIEKGLKELNPDIHFDLGAKHGQFRATKKSHPLVHGHLDVGAKRTVLIYGMYDVQPVEGQDWPSAPFSAEIRPHGANGPCIFARCACNSKGPLMAFLHAVAAWRAVDRLPDARRRAVILRFVEEMTPAEIAGVLGRSEGSVRVLIHRALRSVADDLRGRDAAAGRRP